MRRPAFLMLSTLERRVFFVALASLLPIAILSSVLLISNARDRQERLYRGAEDTVSALLKAVEAELKGSIASLDALAASPRLARENFAELHDEALELLGRRPAWLNVVVSDATHQLMNARLPADMVLPDIAAPDSVAETMLTRHAVIGNVTNDPQLNTPVFEVQIPYERAGKVRFVISAAIRPDSLLNLVDVEQLGERGVIVVLDREDMIVTRSLNHTTSVGHPPSQGLLGMLRATSGPRGRGITYTLEGVPAYTVFSRSPFCGWVAAMGIPKAAIDGPLHRSYLIFGSSLLLSLLLGLALALLVGRTIVRPMEELEEQAALVGRGEAPGMPKTRLPEVRRIAVALAAAHADREALFQREREARLVAEHNSKAKDEFLAMLGHELRNPLAAISNASQVIERKQETLEPTVATANSIIGRQSRHLARLTDDLLDAGRVILGKISMVKSKIDLAEAVDATLQNMKNTGRFNAHELITDLKPVWIYADPTRIDQIVSNLVTNAIKYTPSGGKISVTTSRDQQTAVLTVTDSGIGLEPALLPRVFELFVQGERALDRSQGGLGIGLTLVQRLAELHFGSASVQSEGTGRGATFMVHIPSVEAPVGPAPSAPVVTTTSRVVALVEDNADARASLQLLLEFDGHQVLAAGDGNEGVELFEKNPHIEIGFIDIGLPGMDGHAVARAVREMRGSSVRIVAMSGYGAENDISRGLQSGFDAYIVKPADPDEVAREIAKITTTPAS
jgi:signal transduction histidine kinase/ActR/RegA family two-component response regulator